ncbi:MAG: squalene/phytoene synthase family protein [Planctomycetota bacterium]
MTLNTAKLSRRITWKSSKQTYCIGRLMVDRHLVDDFYRAYAYLRWVDDIIDESHQTDRERNNFIALQRKLVDDTFQGEFNNGLQPEEQIFVDLVRNNPSSMSGLASFIKNVFAIVEFDARRRGQLIKEQELDWYIECLGKAVIDGLQYFIGHENVYSDAKNRHFASSAAHITHLLRDTVDDIKNGFINIPREYLEKHPFDITDLSHPDFIEYVRKRVTLARELFREGKKYIDSLTVLRCKIVGYWYCSRFEYILKTIERDGFLLRSHYGGVQKALSIAHMIWIAISIPLSQMFSIISKKFGNIKKDHKTLLD